MAACYPVVTRVPAGWWAAGWSVLAGVADPTEDGRVKEGGAGGEEAGVGGGEGEEGGGPDGRATAGSGQETEGALIHVMWMGPGELARSTGVLGDTGGITGLRDGALRFLLRGAASPAPPFVQASSSK